MRSAPRRSAVASERLSVVTGLSGSGLVATVNPKTGEPPMTDDMMNLRSLLAKVPDTDVLLEMIGFAAERQIEREGCIIARVAHGEKRPLRLA